MFRVPPHIPPSLIPPPALYPLSSYVPTIQPFIITHIWLVEENKDPVELWGFVVGSGREKSISMTGDSLPKQLLSRVEI